MRESLLDVGFFDKSGLALLKLNAFEFQTTAHFLLFVSLSFLRLGIISHATKHHLRYPSLAF